MASRPRRCANLKGPDSIPSLMHSIIGAAFTMVGVIAGHLVYV